MLLTTRRDTAGSTFTLREVSLLAQCPAQAVGKRWMRLMLQIQRERRQQLGGTAGGEAGGEGGAEGGGGAGGGAGGPVVAVGAGSSRAPAPASLDPALLLERFVSTLHSL